MSTNKSQHSISPFPVFLVPDKIPVGKDWTTTRPTSSSKFRTTQIRSIHFSDGSNVRYYRVVPRPVPEHVRVALHDRAAKLVKAISQEDTESIVRKERRLLKAAPRKLPAKALKRLRKRLKKNSIQ